jgi:GNAT superfamily N-acetyltransferase
MIAPEKTIPPDIVLRSVVIPDDEVFLKDLYFSTREDLKLLPLDDAQKQVFITLQYSAQKHQYGVQFPDAAHDLILRDGIPVGRLLVNRRSNAIYLVDISLLAMYRGMGIGTAVMNGLIEEAENAGVVLGLHVLKTSAAANLYFRMGFTVTADDGLYLEMQKIPNSNI